MKLNKIDGKTVKGFVEWLKEKQCGCCHFHLCNTDKHLMHICVGWHDTGDEAVIAWKIGMETLNNALQCDLDMDFLMPYNEETGDVYDTLQEIEDGTTDYRSIAAEMNRVAPDVVKFQMEQEGMTEDDAIAA
jgi:hypothetical protein